jgi:catechol 2,3-dioxygenase-like lactoylglutathione lyase family enzyme
MRSVVLLNHQGKTMKRFHVHAHVADLPASIAFYSKMFAAEPARVEADYAKWMLDDPRINFAISTGGGNPGVDHLGFQTDTDEELAELKARARAADLTLLDEGEVSCCYARSDKHWLMDPQGIAWEHFRTLANIPVFGESTEPAAESKAKACCAMPAATPSAAAALAKRASCC